MEKSLTIKLNFKALRECFYCAYIPDELLLSFAEKAADLGYNLYVYIANKGGYYNVMTIVVTPEARKRQALINGDFNYDKGEYLRIAGVSQCKTPRGYLWKEMVSFFEAL